MKKISLIMQVVRQYRNLHYLFLAKPTHKYLFFVFFCLFWSKGMAQSPWIPKTKGGFFQVGYSGLFYNQVRVEDRVLSTNRNSIDQTLQLYTDYGLSKKIGLLAILPFKSVSFKTDTEKNRLLGLSNATIGIKYLLIDKISKLTFGVNLSLNTIRRNDNFGLRTGYDAHTILPFVAFGTGTKKMYFYANIGYGKRTNGYSDFARISGEMGHKVFKNGYLVGTIDLNRPLNSESEFYKNEKPNYFLSVNYLDRQLFNGIGLKFIYEIIHEKYGVVVSTIGSLGAENIPFSRSYNIGFYQKF